MPDRSVTVTIRANDQTGPALQNYKRNMSDAEKATRDMGSSADRTGLDMDRLGTAIKGAIAGIGIMAVKNFAEDFNALGVQVNATNRIFNQLASELGAPTESLLKMRAATLGAVDDMTLMGGANQFLRMNLATTGDELAKLTEIAIKLKRPTVDATTAVQDFAMLLSQQSILRLDNFGFSSGRVRDRINELLASGEALNRSDAFRLAVMEEGQKALDRLGSAADVAGTAFGRLQTRLENFSQQAASNFARGVEGLATGLELALGTHPAQIAKAERDAKEAVEDIGAVLTSVLNESMFKDAFPTGFIEQFVNEAIIVAQQSPELTNNLDSFTRVVLGRIGKDAFAGGNMMPDIQSLSQATLQVRASNAELRERRRLMDEAVAIENERLDLLKRQQETQERIGKLTQERSNWMGDFFGLESSLAGAGVPRGLTDLLSGDFELPRFIERDQADAIQSAADEAVRLVEEMDRLEELSPEMFTDEQVDQMKSIADETEKLAKEADKAATAFEKIKLSDVFGQTGGGMQGQINDMVIQAMKDAGMSDETIAAFQRAGALSSGQETTGSLALQEQVVPKIANIAQTDPALAAWATNNLSAILAQVALRNIDPNSPEFISLLEDAMGVQGGGAGTAFTITPFQTPNAGATLQTQLGKTPEEMAKWFKDTYGVDLGSGAFSNIAGDLNLTPTPEEIRPQIEDAMAKQMLATINGQGYTLVSKDEILGSPKFQETVNQAVQKTLDELTNPQGEAGNIGTSTLSGIQAMLAGRGINVTLDQLLGATGAETPNVVQPGTYNLEQFAQDGQFSVEGFFSNFDSLSGQSEIFKTNFNSFLGDLTTAQDPVVVIETAMSNISTYGQNLQTAMEKLTSKVQEVKVKVKVEYDDSKGWLEQTVKNNGGRVPGATMN